MGVPFETKVFGWLVLLVELEATRDINNHPKRRFLCKCKCGNLAVRTLDGIKGAKTPSCGCFMSYYASNRIKHGMTGTRIFSVWAQLKTRCYKKNSPSYKRYGAKGITVCERWKSFVNFYEDMGATYKAGLTLDRINGKGNYEKSNCRWATYKQQNRNLTSNKMITVGSYTKCVSEFTEVMGYKKGIINGRLLLDGRMKKLF